MNRALARNGYGSTWFDGHRARTYSHYDRWTVKSVVYRRLPSSIPARSRRSVAPLDTAGAAGTAALTYLILWSALLLWASGLALDVFLLAGHARLV